MGWRFLSLSQWQNVDLTNFDCGDTSVNHFLVNNALSCEKESLSRVFLMLSDADELIGYYTLGASIIPLGEIPNKYKRGIPNFPFPAVLIGQFGITKKWQGQGLSYVLLGDIYRRIILLYQQKIIAFRAIRVDVQDQKAKAFWLKQGFIEFKKNSNSLFIPVQTILNEFEIKSRGFEIG
jgi:GNAT superfamily N-acetyltransferase